MRRIRQNKKNEVRENLNKDKNVLDLVLPYFISVLAARYDIKI